MSEQLPEIDEWREEGQQVAIATVTKVESSAPRPVKTRLAMTAEGEMAGSVNSGYVENAIVMEAQEMLRTNTPKLLRYGITDDMA